MSKTANYGFTLADDTTLVSKDNINTPVTEIDKLLFTKIAELEEKIANSGGSTGEHMHIGLDLTFDKADSTLCLYMQFSGHTTFPIKYVALSGDETVLSEDSVRQRSVLMCDTSKFITTAQPASFDAAKQLFAGLIPAKAASDYIGIATIHWLRDRLYIYNSECDCDSECDWDCDCDCDCDNDCSDCDCDCD